MAEPAARRCQVALLSAAGHYMERRLQERRRGLRATRAWRQFEGVSRVCDGVRVQGEGEDRVPRVAGTCARLAGTPGQEIVGRDLARCLRASFEGLTDDVAPAALRPNVILVLTDDQRWDTVGFMPATFERLVGQGVTFTNAFATTPVCSPSRASIYSGKIARHHGVVHNGREPMFDPSETVATALSSQGYVTGFFGKYLNAVNTLAAAPPPGWNEWSVFLESSGGSYVGSHLNENGVVNMLGLDDYSTDVLRDRAVDFVRRNASRPFFAVYAPYAPHDPTLPAPRHLGVLDGLPPHRPPSWNERDLSQKPVWVRFLARIVGPEAVRRRDRRRIRELETLLSVDDAVHALTDQLERAGVADETVLIFTSDHGLHWGEHWSGTKFSAYEESIRVPLVVRYPRASTDPRVVESLVGNIDLAPTVAALGGAKLPGADGESLLPFVMGTELADWRDEIAIESPGGLITARSRALRTARWKYIELGVKHGVAAELYDLREDPFELRNLAFDPELAPLRVELAERLQQALP